MHVKSYILNSAQQSLWTVKGRAETHYLSFLPIRKTKGLVGKTIDDLASAARIADGQRTLIETEIRYMESIIVKRWQVL